MTDEMPQDEQISDEQLDEIAGGVTFTAGTMPPGYSLPPDNNARMNFKLGDLRKAVAATGQAALGPRPANPIPKPNPKTAGRNTNPSHAS